MTRYKEQLGKMYCIMTDGKLVEGELHDAVVHYNCWNDYAMCFRFIPHRYSFYGTMAFKGEDRAVFLMSKTRGRQKVVITGIGESENMIGEVIDDIYEKTRIEEDSSVTTKELEKRLTARDLVMLGFFTGEISRMSGADEIIETALKDMKEQDKRKAS